MEVKMRFEILLRFACILLWLGLAGCVTTMPPMLTDVHPTAPLEDWDNYGAYYEYDEMRIKVEGFDREYNFGVAYSLNQKIRILNRKGVEHGTLEVERLSENVSAFDLRVTDPNGKNVVLDNEKIREKYLDTGTIVVPQVQPGCQIYLKINFISSKFLHGYEHWLRKPIPVLKSRFTFVRPIDFGYRVKGYGGLQSPEEFRMGQMKGYVWDSANILPEDDVFENRWRQDLEPRVQMRLMRLHTRHFVYDALKWKGLAKDYRSFFLSPSIFTFRSRLKKQVEEITWGLSSPRQKAEAILEYVQNEISLVEDGSINTREVYIQKVIKGKKGDRWDKAVVLKEMLQIAGIQTHAYATRPRNAGGFDPDFPSWRLLSFPLIAAVIDGKEEIAYHYYQVSSIGEYPFQFFDNQALDLANGKITSLPEPAHRTYAYRKHATVSLDKWDQGHKWQHHYSRYAGMFMRRKLSDLSKAKQKRIFQKKLEGYDARNEVTHLQVNGLGLRGDVEAVVTLKNDSFKTEQPGMAHYSLAPWYSKMFENLDPSAKTDYNNGLEVSIEENILIKSSDDHAITVHYPCLPLDNSLFSQECAQEKSDDGILLKRKLIRKKSRIRPDQIAALMPDIDKLNRVDESYVIEKAKQAE